jgi:hypothetical protein
MNKNKFRNIKKQKNKKNKKTVEIVIIEETRKPINYNKLLYLAPLLFLLFNSSNLFMFAPLIFLCYSWFNKPNELIPNKEQINKEVNKDQLDIMFILPIMFILFILFFVFFYFIFSYLRMKTSLPCIQSCDSIVNSVSSNVDISSIVNM